MKKKHNFSVNFDHFLIKPFHFISGNFKMVLILHSKDKSLLNKRMFLLNPCSNANRFHCIKQQRKTVVVLWIISPPVLQVVPSTSEEHIVSVTTTMRYSMFLHNTGNHLPGYTAS
jgi:hypothetical protein